MSIALIRGAGIRRTVLLASLPVLGTYCLLIGTLAGFLDALEATFDAYRTAWRGQS